MDLFDVYPLLDVEPIRGKGSYVFDAAGIKYLDLYGGHAVISIGHSHPHYLKRLMDQAQKLGFYSNSVRVPQQQELADHLGWISGYDDYKIFFCNSGAEANENALKLASFHTGKSRIIAFERAFHGRTAGAVAVTDNPKYRAPINKNEEVVFLPFNNIDLVKQQLAEGDVAAVIIEGIQGVGGVNIPADRFLQQLKEECKEYEVPLILDEVQSGYGRSGKFFAHQYAGINPDIITVAKGMGNGFPLAGVLIAPHFNAWHGMLGTTFGGNHLACAAGIAVLEVLEKENLMINATKIGSDLVSLIISLPHVKEVRGRGLMIGIDLDIPAGPVRQKLLNDYQVFTGSSSKENNLRLLPPLTIGMKEVEYFINSFKQVLNSF